MVFERVKTMISEQFDIEKEDITMETSFQGDLDADSLDLVELIMVIEDELDLEIEDEEVEKIKTVGNAVEYIQKHIDLD